MMWWFIIPIVFLVLWTGYSLWWFVKKFNIVDFGPRSEITTFALIPIVVIIMALAWVDKTWKKYGKYVWR